jgi:hypothetical protein
MRNLRTFTILCFILLLCGALFLVNGQEKRRPSRFLIPDGYVGWVRIDFKIKGAPALPLEDGYFLFKIPPEGRLQTSSDIEYGAALDEYYYYSGDARRRLDNSKMIHQSFNGRVGDAPAKDRPPTFQFFFVGVEEIFMKYRFTGDNNYPDADEDFLPKVGNKNVAPCEKKSNP